MKIWIDSRKFIKNYEKFFFDFLFTFVKIIEKNDILNIYIYDDFIYDFSLFQNKNINIYKIQKSNNIFFQQLSFWIKLNKDKNDFLLTFEEHYPIFIKTKVIQIISSLEYILYPNLYNTKIFFKQFFIFFCNKSLKKSTKIVTFNKNTKLDLNEQFNIKEEKINIIEPFFYSSNKAESIFNVQTKHSFTWDYIIYDDWISNAKNINILIDILKEINIKNKLNIIFIWEETSRNLELRNYIIFNKLQKNCFFIWNPLENELWVYYNQALAVIYPWNYYSFPFFMSNALNFNTLILSSNLQEINDILWEKVIYFSQNSYWDILKKINKIIWNNIKNIDYSEILVKYSKQNFCNNLYNLFK